MTLEMELLRAGIYALSVFVVGVVTGLKLLDILLDI